MRILRTAILFSVLFVSIPVFAVENLGQIRHELESMRDYMGVVYFYRPNCLYCVEQKRILEEFRQRYNWQNIKAINIQEYPSVAEKFGIKMVPDVWLVGKTDDGVKQRRISTGVIDADGIVGYLRETHYLWFSRQVPTPGQAPALE